MIQQSQSLAYIWRKVEKVKVKSLSHVRLFVTQWTVAHHAPLSMGFSRQEYSSRLSLPLPGDLPSPGIKPTSHALQADSSLLSHQGSPRNHMCPMRSPTLTVWLFTKYGSYSSP